MLKIKNARDVDRGCLYSFNDNCFILVVVNDADQVEVYAKAPKAEIEKYLELINDYEKENIEKKENRLVC